MHIWNRRLTRASASWKARHQGCLVWEMKSLGRVSILESRSAFRAESLNFGHLRFSKIV